MKLSSLIIQLQQFEQIRGDKDVWASFEDNDRLIWNTPHFRFDIFIRSPGVYNLEFRASNLTQAKGEPNAPKT